MGRRLSELGALGLITLLLISTAAVPAQDESAAPRNIILIGWDGAQRNHLYECIGRGELPNLVALSAKGALINIDIDEKTDTKAGWTQILTGYRAQRTGVFGNNAFQPIPIGYTAFERLEQHFGAENFATLAVIGKKNNLGCAAPQVIPYAQVQNALGLTAKGEKRKQNKGGKRKAKKQWKKKMAQGHVIEANEQEYLVVPGEPYYYTRTTLDVFENGLGIDDIVGARALEVLEQYQHQPFFFFIHFADVDHKGHKHGENSTEYNDALISGDYWLGQICAKLEELGLAKDTLIYVTADHGFDEGKKAHKDAPYVFLATNDPLVAGHGNRADITPTILERFGVALSAFVPPLDGKSLLK